MDWRAMPLPAIRDVASTQIRHFSFPRRVVTQSFRLPFEEQSHRWRISSSELGIGGLPEDQYIPAILIEGVDYLGQNDHIVQSDALLSDRDWIELRLGGT